MWWFVWWFVHHKIVLNEIEGQQQPFESISQQESLHEQGKDPDQPARNNWLDDISFELPTKYISYMHIITRWSNTASCTKIITWQSCHTVTQSSHCRSPGRITTIPDNGNGILLAVHDKRSNPHRETRPHLRQFKKTLIDHCKISPSSYLNHYRNK